MHLGGAWYGLLSGFSCSENVPSKHPIPLNTSSKSFMYLLCRFSALFLAAFIGWTWKEIHCSFIRCCFDHWISCIVSWFWNAVHVCLGLLSSVCFLLWLRLPDSVHVCTPLITISGIFSTYWVNIYFLLCWAYLCQACLIMPVWSWELQKIYIFSYYLFVLLLLYTSLTGLL